MGCEFHKIPRKGWLLVELPDGRGHATQVDAARALMAMAEAQDKELRDYRREHGWRKAWDYERVRFIGVRCSAFEARTILNRIENEHLPRKQRTNYKQPRKLGDPSDRFTPEQPTEPAAKHRHRSPKCLPYSVMGKIIKENAT